MNGFKSISVTFIIMFAAVFNALGQYDISFDIKNLKDDTILMGYYHMGATLALDTAVNNKGKIRFKNKNKTLDDGIYFITNRKGKNCEFLIYKDQNLSFKTSDDNWVDNLEVNGNKNEAVYVEYIKQSNKLGEQYRELLRGRDTVSKQEYDSKLKIFSVKNDSLHEDFIKKYPDHLLSKILMCAKPLEIPDFPVIYADDGSVDSLQMRKDGFCWYKKHYFDNVDFAYSGVMNTNKQVFADNYNYYWDTVMMYEKADSILYYADFLISKATDKKMADFLIFDITKRYLQDGIMGHDKVYVGMVDRYFKTGKYQAMAVSDIERNIMRADVWRNLLIGQQVPDLACPQSDSVSAWHHLDEIKNKYKILIFWSVDCSHCTKEIPQIAEFYKQYKKMYDLEVFAVHTDGKLQERDEFLTKYGIDWINVNGLFANYDWRSYFDIDKTPVIYILNADDEILAKNVSHGNLKQVMDILEKGGFNL